MRPLRRVWRVERKDNGFGPFCGGLWHNPCRNQNHNWARRMPTPYMGHRRGPTNTRFHHEYRYAFDGIHTLAKWLCGCARAEAHSAGYVVRVFGVPWDSHTLLTDQVVYRKSDAILLRELSLPEIDVELEVCRLRQMAA